MTRLVWSKPSDRQYETGLDRGVLYPKKPAAVSYSTVVNGSGSKTFTLESDMRRTFKLDSLLRVTESSGIGWMTGTVTAISETSVTINVTAHNDLHGFFFTSYSEWSLVRLDLAVPWNGLVSVDEVSGDSATAYYLDGRPFLWLPKPKEFAANIKAFTYPDAFAESMGLIEAADGLYLDSQMGEAFDLSYRTLVGDGVSGDVAGYKIHIVYNATVTPPANSYATISDSINNSTFSWDIQAVPVPVSGYRSTAHIVIDTRHMEADRIATIETLLYGDDTTSAAIPDPQTIFDILSFGDGIVITDFGDGTWSAEGSYENIYLLGDGVFQIDNVDAVDHGDGTYDISTTP